MCELFLWILQFQSSAGKQFIRKQSNMQCMPTLFEITTCLKMACIDFGPTQTGSSPHLSDWYQRISMLHSVNFTGGIYIFCVHLCSSAVRHMALAQLKNNRWHSQISLSHTNTWIILWGMQRWSNSFLHQQLLTNHLTIIFLSHLCILCLQLLHSARNVCVCIYIYIYIYTYMWHPGHFKGKYCCQNCYCIVLC